MVVEGLGVLHVCPRRPLRCAGISESFFREGNLELLMGYVRWAKAVANDVRGNTGYLIDEPKKRRAELMV